MYPSSSVPSSSSSPAFQNGSGLLCFSDAGGSLPASSSMSVDLALPADNEDLAALPPFPSFVTPCYEDNPSMSPVWTSSKCNGFSFASEGYESSILDSINSGFGRQEYFFPQVSEVFGNGRQNPMHSFIPASFEINFGEKSNSISFSTFSSKQPKFIGEGDNFQQLLEFQLSLPQTTAERARVENQFNSSQISSFYKVRAKSGFAAQPRSIVEKERRTKINEKLKQLHELLPDKDKHTSYSDMLDSAIMHIVNLQDEFQKLQNESQHCRCRRKRDDLED